MIPIVALIVGGAIALFRPLAQAEKLKAQQTKIPADVTMRLERIEQSVEAIALEVERISEGQRFVTKLLAERGASAGQLPPSAASAASAGNPASPALGGARPPGEQRS